MPGMMDTVLNVGLNDVTVQGLARKSGNERFAYDAYRRFITMFGSVVMGVERSKFEDILDEKKDVLKVREDTEIGADALKDVVTQYQQFEEKVTGTHFPQDPLASFLIDPNYVFDSWYA